MNSIHDDKENVKFDPTSLKAEEFINDEEIQTTLEFAEKNKTNARLIDSILEKGRDGSGLNHQEALVLFECELPEYNRRILDLARQIKRKYFGNRIVVFTPLYLANYCVNGCIYCPYHVQNRGLRRFKLSQEEIRNQVVALQNRGCRRLSIETGEDPVEVPIEYILDSLQTIYSASNIKLPISRVNVNIAATSVENYRKLAEARIGTYELFQETYNKAVFEELHPSGPKHDYVYHTEAIDRAMEGGIDDVGLGVLLGLSQCEYDLTGLLLHTEHLVATKGIGPHTINVPRIRKADDVDDVFSTAISDDVFEKIVAVLRIAVPYVGLTISTQESRNVRDRALLVGASQISGGQGEGRNSDPLEEDRNDAQRFGDVDHQSLDEVVDWLIGLGVIPSFCTSCSLPKSQSSDQLPLVSPKGASSEQCDSMALTALNEFLEDYASEGTKNIGGRFIQNELQKLSNDQLREFVSRRLDMIHHGARGFRG